MWPWEHVLFAYVFFSLYMHVRHRAPPEHLPTVLLAFGSLFPDVVDKPLAWQYGLFETGWGVAHSVFIAAAVSLLGYAVTRRAGFGRIGIGFGFGYLLHLVGDVIPASVSRGRLYLDPILWPFGNPTTSSDPGSFLDGVSTLLFEYATQLLALEITPILVLQLGSVAVGSALWIYDGLPGARPIFVWVHRAVFRGRST
ncbi:MAG: metal-dependent hydrolase [Halobacteriota archaeon]|uniref:metal-dependent hydrolase n=1 Tax=Natronomonas sp. TaxID=2184060 RepID=UPI003976268C